MILSKNIQVMFLAFTCEENAVERGESTLYIYRFLAEINHY
jgi:hypothetical protein